MAKDSSEDTVLEKEKPAEIFLVEGISFNKKKKVKKNASICASKAIILFKKHLKTTVSIDRNEEIKSMHFWAKEALDTFTNLVNSHSINGSSNFDEIIHSLYLISIGSITNEKSVNFQIRSHVGEIAVRNYFEKIKGGKFKVNSASEIIADIGQMERDILSAKY